MNIPFFPNTGDGTHCFQAALKMVLKFFWPTRDFTYEELDRLSAKEPGQWTWPTTAMMWLIEQGFELKLIEDFDYLALAERGADYLVEKCGAEVAQAQIEHSDLAREQAVARRFAKIAPLLKRPATLKDAEILQQAGWVIICNINAAVLYGQTGYSGHFVVLQDIFPKNIVLHDPGLPPAPSFKTTRKIFEKAWGYPNENEKNLLAIRWPKESLG